MRKNVFVLEQVLNFRKEVEKVREMELASAMSEFETAHSRLRSEYGVHGQTS
jgi:flagellar FliJ protein